MSVGNRSAPPLRLSDKLLRQMIYVPYTSREFKLCMSRRAPRPELTVGLTWSDALLPLKVARRAEGPRHALQWFGRFHDDSRPVGFDLRGHDGLMTALSAECAAFIDWKSWSGQGRDADQEEESWSWISARGHVTSSSSFSSSTWTGRCDWLRGAGAVKDVFLWISQRALIKCNDGWESWAHNYT